MNISVKVSSEQGVVFMTKERLPGLLNGITSMFVQTRYPDLTLEMDDGTFRFYEIEYKLLNFFRHQHHTDSRLCHGIIYWLDDRAEPKAYAGKIQKTEIDELMRHYDLICINPDQPFKEFKSDLLVTINGIEEKQHLLEIEIEQMKKTKRGLKKDISILADQQNSYEMRIFELGHMVKAPSGHYDFIRDFWKPYQEHKTWVSWKWREKPDSNVISMNYPKLIA